MTDDQSQKQLLLMGDRAEDTFIQLAPPVGGKNDDKGANYPSWNKWIQPGGVEMLSNYLKILDEDHHWHEEFSTVVVSSLSRVEYVDKDGSLSKTIKDKVKEDGNGKNGEKEHPRYRISNFDGYQADLTKTTSGTNGKTDPHNQNRSFQIVAINDAGRGIRNEPDIFSKLLDNSDENSCVLLKRHLPLIPNFKDAQDALWETFTACRSQRILVVSADDLRAHGLRLSRGLSWDAVAHDIQIALDQRDSALNYLASSVHYMIVLFDVEAAAVIYQNKNTRLISAHLVFDPSRAEGDVEEAHPGSIYGKMNYFTARFLKLLAQNHEFNEDDVIKHVEQTMPWLQGYVKLCMQDNEKPKHTLVVDIKSTEGGHTYQSTNIDYDPQLPSPSLIATKNLSEIAVIAEDVVKEGVKKLEGIPSANFRDFTTVDRFEIESYRAINRLIQNYLENPDASKPLSIAVFGAPGSGKSFGVEQLVDKKVTPIKTFNLSEATVDDLPGFFHEIRTECLKGNTPLCFFDEFDTDKCNLVSSFLAPMQDGKFREGARVHPTGRGIFVFAGGTTSCFQEFYENAEEDQREKGGKKMMDFVSRLSGFIDVKGPNSSTENSDSDHFLQLRRAILLRALIEKNMPSIINPNDKLAAIEDPVIRVFLRIDRYKHGARSIEKLLNMCAQGQQKDRLTVSDLPHEAQLNLHVSARQFLMHAAQNS